MYNVLVKHKFCYFGKRKRNYARNFMEDSNSLMKRMVEKYLEAEICMKSNFLL